MDWCRVVWCGVVWCAIGWCNVCCEQACKQTGDTNEEKGIPGVILGKQQELVVKCKCNGMCRDQQSHCCLQLLGITA